MSSKWKCEVVDTPCQLLTGSEWDGLSQQVWDTFKKHQQTNKTFDKKIRLKEKIYKIIRVCFPNQTIFLYLSLILLLAKKME